MRLLSIFRSSTYITFFLSAVRAFNVTVGTPTQCDNLSVSWTGGQAPFEILLVPIYETPYNISVPESAFSNGKGSYSIPQLQFKSKTQLLLTMSDATGFGSGGTTTVLTVGDPIANNNCNTTVISPDFTFELLSSLQQCDEYTFSNYSGAIQPITITALIPGGEFVIMNPPNGSTSFNWDVDVQEGTDMIFFMVDSQRRQGGVSDIEQVALSSNTSCLSVNSPSSTTSTPSQTSSQSTATGTSGNSNSTANVGIIAGATVGGVVFLGLIIIIGIYCKRKASRSSDTAPSSKRRKDNEYEAEEDGIINPFKYPTNRDRVSHVLLPTRPGGQLHPANVLASDSFPQNSPQNSYTDYYAGGPYPSTRMTTTSEQIASQGAFPHQTLPVGLSIHTGSLTNTSAGNFTVNDHHAPFSEMQSSRVDYMMDGLSGHGDSTPSSMSLASRQVAAMTSQTAPPDYPFPYQTYSASLPVSPIQSGAVPHHTPTRSVSVSVSTTDPIPRSTNSSISFPRGSMAIAAGQTAAGPSQVIVHTDIEDVPATPDAQDVLELPPQYADRQPPVPQPAPSRSRKSSRR